MAKQRSRRLRKKMRIDEFQELGFSVKWTFPENTPIEEVDRFVDELILKVIGCKWLPELGRLNLLTTNW